MKMAERRPLDDRELESLFAAARQSRAYPSDALLERIMDDAMKRDGKRVNASAAASVVASRSGLLARISGVIGGWAGAGLVTATVAGLAIGFFAAEPLDGLSSGYLATAVGYSLEDIMPSFFDLIGET